MKRKMLATSLLALTVVIGGCSALTSSTETKTEANFVNQIATQDEVYGLSAMSSSSLLKSLVTTSISPMGLKREVTPEDIEKVNGYLSMFESLLSDEGLLSSKVEASDLEGYTYKMTITTKNLLGNVETYVMYYNEVVLTEVVEEQPELPEKPLDEGTLDEVVNEVKNHFKEEHQFDRKHDDEEEVSTKIEGIMTIGDVTYDVIGLKVVENDEVKTHFISKIDKNNYVKVSNVVEDDEQKFKFTVVQDGKLVSKSEIKLEKEENKTKIDLVVFENNQLSRYSFKKIVEDNKEIIMIDIVEGFNRTSIKVFVKTNAETGETTYVYQMKDGKEFAKDRHHEFEEKGHGKGHK